MKRLIITFMALLLLISFSWNRGSSPRNVDLDAIRHRGKLIAATGYGANSYFIYRGQPLGYEYELLNLLGEHLGLNIELRIIRDMDEAFSLLNRGEVDIIAQGLTVTKERAKKVAFTVHHQETRQVLVQRKPENWRLMKLHEVDRFLVRSPIDLVGKKIYVWEGSSYYERLLNLNEEIGGGINTVVVPGNLSTEDLIAQVAEGEIDYTVADEHIARINASYYTNIDIETPISLEQRLAWALRKSSPQLLEALNQWITEMKKSDVYYTIYDKYYLDRSGFRKRVSSEFYTYGGGKISPFDDLIKECSTELNWDWLLLASLIYHESLFDPQTESWAGAVGLMQLIPETAYQFGAVDIFDPNQNIKAGTNYLKWLKELWQEIPDSTERTKFVLASYNAGQGHILDAQRLALKYGRDPYTWEDNVGYFVLKKSSEEYFNDEVVLHGYCRGQETYAYVEDVLKLYEHYKKHLTPQDETPISGEGVVPSSGGS